jgi:uncharacterized protein (UPF0335 family)
MTIPPGIGHNSETTETGGVSGERLKAYIDRIERLTEEVDGLQSDIKDIKADAKGLGFSVPTINAIVKLRKLDPEKRREAEQRLELSKAAIGLA